MTLKTPKHYSQSEKQPIELMKEFMSADAYEGFLVGNVVKYIMRYKYKDGLTDLLKCKDYLEILISEFNDEDSTVKEEISNVYNVSNDSRATTASSKDYDKSTTKTTAKSSKKEELDF